MTADRSPELSVILATDTFKTIRRVVACLREQRARDRIELVIIAPSRSALAADGSALDGFCGVKIIECGELTSLSTARAAGIRAASAPVVFLAETHAFPLPGWADAMIAAHRGEWAVVMPGMANANPDSAMSWAQFLTDYGPWLDDLPAGETARFPTWPTSYKRAHLLAFGDQLTELLTQGDGLLRALADAGHRFYFEPAARIAHLNVPWRGPWVRERYFSGVAIASSRMGGWSWARRLAYVVGAPLIPAVVLLRARKGLQASRRAGRLPLGVLPAVAASTVVSAVGEMAGYAGLSVEAARRAMTEFELHREP